MMAWMNILRRLDKKMKQIRWELLHFFLHKICWFKSADGGHARYSCNPCAQPEKCHAANLLNLKKKCPQSQSKYMN